MMNLNFNTKKIGFFAISGIIVLLIILAFTTKEEENITQVDSSALEVQVATPVYDKITEWDEYSGRFEASNRVEVRARVSGFLEKVNFSDGQMVEKGQVLCFNTV